MFEIRFHGRGGQGAVMASEILALAAFMEGKHPQSFPSFGLERRGAPVAAFLRVDDAKIGLRHAIYEPDFIVVMDRSLLKIETTLKGLKPGGGLLINSAGGPDSLGKIDGIDGNSNIAVGTVDASGIALKNGLGSRLMPIINTTILGAVVRMTNIVSMESLETAIEETIAKKGEDNRLCAREAYERVIF
ncbi:MAG: 2-oxoacid:acceptor oxidoreductase family protein [Deltaproteobacteria bacterium]|uniref:2-oxoacid:acceptor oxidoreductase family protein n=1 Tax=Candidatus Zymogenus saltonus TaxID=2844893 RepID=A0A9D8KE80_9DELT|nr:2-oxoacid:acceptor oxidoreductase family protein [Candidatus Zymogenus saltonus]